VQTSPRSSIAIAVLLLSLPSLGQSGPKGLQASPSAKSLPDVVQEVSTSIVRVTALFTAQVTGQDLAAPVQMNWTSGGTGFIVDTQGHIATAGHVIDIVSNQAQFEKALPGGKALVPGSFRAAGIQVAAPPLNLEDDGRGNSFYNIVVSHQATLMKQDQRLDVAFLISDGNLMFVPAVQIGRRSVVRKRPDFPS
jgi:S1-C subfamily serine protease